MMNNIDWDSRFLNLAKEISSWSKDPSTKVGAIIVNGKEIVSLGYNGFPRGVNDYPERYENRDIKYAFTVHAEANAILSAKRNVADFTLYSTLFPCSSCAGLIIQSGIKCIVSPEPDMERWAKSFEASKTMFDEANITYKIIRG
jgi:dCMP deaminase